MIALNSGMPERIADPAPETPASARIERVRSWPLALPATLTLAGHERRTRFSACLVEITTSDGLTGHGFTAITEEEVIAAIVAHVAGPALIGEDPMAPERLWSKLHWLLAPRGQSGYAAHAIAALDIALWDLRGKRLGQPVWRLLGGAHPRVPVYATFGFAFLESAALVQAARDTVAAGFTRLKMVVGHEALQKNGPARPIGAVVERDIARIAAVRDAIGPGIGLAIDANCSLDALHARRLAEAVRPLGLSFFEEPLAGNDVAGLADLRQRCGIPLAAGQNEGLLSRFRDFLVARALDIVQPNVAITGGFTQCAKIAGMAEAFGVTLANGGAWPQYNMHLQAGLSSGTLVEWHLGAVAACQGLFPDMPVPQEGWLDLPERPGLGFSPDPLALAEYARLPGLQGHGKG